MFGCVSEPLRVQFGIQGRAELSSKTPREHPKAATVLPKRSKVEPLGPQSQQRKPTELQRYPPRQKTTKKFDIFMKIWRENQPFTSVT